MKKSIALLIVLTTARIACSEVVVSKTKKAEEYSIDEIVETFLHKPKEFDQIWGELPREVGVGIAQDIMTSANHAAVFKKFMPPPATFLTSNGRPQSLEFNLLGNHLISCSHGLVNLWDTNGRCKRTLKVDESKESKTYMYATLSPNETVVAASSLHYVFEHGEEITDAGCQHTIELISLADNSTQTLRGHTNNISSLHFNERGNMLLSSSWDNTVKIWNTENGSCIQTLARPAGFLTEINSAVFNHDCTDVLMACENSAELWNVESNERVCSFTGHSARVNTAVFSPDERYVLTSSDDGTAKLWCTETEECIKTFNHFVKPAHADKIQPKCKSAHFDPLGETIVTAGSQVKLWERKSGECIITLPYYDFDCSLAVFSPSGDTILTTHDQGIMMVTVDALIHLKETLRRNLVFDQSIFLQSLYQTILARGFVRHFGEVRACINGVAQKQAAFNQESLDHFETLNKSLPLGLQAIYATLSSSRPDQPMARTTFGDNYLEYEISYLKERYSRKIKVLRSQLGRTRTGPFASDVYRTARDILQSEEEGIYSTQEKEQLAETLSSLHELYGKFIESVELRAKLLEDATTRKEFIEGQKKIIAMLG